MELELKYSLGEGMAKERIFSDQHLLGIKDAETEATIQMRAVYMDTADGDLQKEKMAFRVRFEDERIVATLKWGGRVENGLHVRGELNVPVNGAFLVAPTVDIFKGSEIYDSIAEAVGGKALKPVMDMEFVRHEVRVDTGRSISVISMDEGFIHTEKGDCPIAEVEVELFSGDQEDMVALGGELAAKYNLTPNDKSKYQRGLELLGIQ